MQLLDPPAHRVALDDVGEVFDGLNRSIREQGPLDRLFSAWGRAALDSLNDIDLHGGALAGAFVAQVESDTTSANDHVGDSCFTPRSRPDLQRVLSLHGLLREDCL